MLQCSMFANESVLQITGGHWTVAETNLPMSKETHQSSDISADKLISIPFTII